MERALRHGTLAAGRAYALCALFAGAWAGCDPAEPDPAASTGTLPDAAVIVATPGGGIGPGGGVGAGGGSVGGVVGMGGAGPVDAAVAPGTAGGTSGAIAGGMTGGPVSGTPDAGAGAGSAWCRAKPVFDRYCTSCHDGKGTAGAPMALKTFADFSADSAQYPGTKVYARALVRMQATTMRMPPQGTVSPAELALVEAWAQAGAQPGDDPTCGGSTGAPQAELQWPKDCEKFYKILAHDERDTSKPYRVAPNAEGHPKFTFDAPWGSEEVQALAFKPVTDNARVLHHWILYQGGGGAFLSGWAPGQDAAKGRLPDDVGMYLPSGPQSLLLDMHYNNLLPGSKEELDASGVEVCVASKPKFRANTASVYMGFAGIGLPMVPANTSNHDLTGVCPVVASTPVHLLTASPHAHKLATHMKFTVQKRDGRQIVLHDEPFDFEEQVSHNVPEEVVLETGDTVTTTCRFTNPTSQDVQFGENTGNEMCFNFSVYYPKDALGCDLLGGILGTGAGGIIGGLLGP